MGTPMPSFTQRSSSGIAEEREASSTVTRIPRRRRWWLLLSAAVLAMAGGLSSAWLVSVADERVEVLVAARTIGWGETVRDADLRATQVPPGTAASLLPVSRRAEVVGQSAAVSVPEGTILAPAHLTSDDVPAAGQVLVGLPVEPGSLPARGLHPGELVSVRPLTDASVSSTPDALGADERDRGRVFEARVVDVGPVNQQGEATVDVVVDADLSDAASEAGAGRVVLILLGPRR